MTPCRDSSKDFVAGSRWWKCSPPSERSNPHSTHAPPASSTRISLDTRGGGGARPRCCRAGSGSRRARGARTSSARARDSAPPSSPPRRRVPAPSPRAARPRRGELVPAQPVPHGRVRHVAALGHRADREPFVESASSRSRSIPPRAACRRAWCDVRPCLLTQYATVDAARPASRAIDSIERPSASGLASDSRSMTTRTLVRVPDGIRVRRWRISSSTFWRSAARALTPVAPVMRAWRCGARGGAGRAGAPRARASRASPRRGARRRRAWRSGARASSSPRGRSRVGGAGGRAGTRRPCGSWARRSSRRRRPRPGAARPPRAARCSRRGTRPRSARGGRARRAGRSARAAARAARNRSRPPPRPRLAVAAAAAIAARRSAARSHGCGRRRGRCAPRSASLTSCSLMPEPVGDELDQLVAQHARRQRADDPARRGEHLVGARARLLQRALDLEALDRAPPRRAARASPPRRTSWTTSAGSCPAGRRTIRNSTARVVRPRVVRRAAPRSRARPTPGRRGPGPGRTAPSGARRAIASTCCSVSAVPICATTSGTPAWCSAITSV